MDRGFIEYQIIHSKGDNRNHRTQNENAEPHSGLVIFGVVVLIGVVIGLCFIHPLAALAAIIWLFKKR